MSVNIVVKVSVMVDGLPNTEVGHINMTEVHGDHATLDVLRVMDAVTTAHKAVANMIPHVVGQTRGIIEMAREGYQGDGKGGLPRRWQAIYST